MSVLRFLVIVSVLAVGVVRGQTCGPGEVLVSGSCKDIDACVAYPCDKGTCLDLAGQPNSAEGRECLVTAEIVVDDDNNMEILARSVAFAIGDNAATQFTIQEIYDDVDDIKTTMADQSVVNDLQTRLGVAEGTLANKADQSSVDASLDLKADASDLDDYALQTDVDLKATKAELNDYALKTALDPYAKTSDVASTYATLANVANKADQAATDEALALKADASDLADYALQADVDTRATKAELTNYALASDLDDYATTADVASTYATIANVANKADQSTMDDALALKADQSATLVALGLKADASDLDVYALQTDVDTKATKAELADYARLTNLDVYAKSADVATTYETIANVNLKADQTATDAALALKAEKATVDNLKAQLAVVCAAAGHQWMEESMTCVAAGTSCEELKALGRKSGFYTIIHPDQTTGSKVYCDMDTDGGGWELLMQIKGSSLRAQYSSDYWTNADLVDVPPFMTGPSFGTDSKHAGFNYGRYTDLQARFRDPNNGDQWTWPTPIGFDAGVTPQKYFTTDKTLFNTAGSRSNEWNNANRPRQLAGQPEWDNSFVDNRAKFADSTCAYRISVAQCVHHSCARWGFHFNNECSQSSNDVGGGIGVAPHVAGVNSAGTWTTCCAGLAVPSTAYDVQIWGRLVGKIASSCLELKNLGKFSGRYTINNDGQHYSTYCDMETDEGGWEMLMNIDGGSNRANYDSDYWTSSSVVDNTGTVPVFGINQKFPGFNVGGYRDLQARWKDPVNGDEWVWTTPAGWSDTMTPQTYFTTEQVLFENYDGNDDANNRDQVGQMEWDNSQVGGTSKFSDSSCAEMIAIAKCTYSNSCSRWGFHWNNECHFNSNDVQGGLGMKPHGTLQSAGNFQSCCQVVDVPVRNYHVQLWGRL